MNTQKQSTNRNDQIISLIMDNLKVGWIDSDQSFYYDSIF